MSIPSSAIYVCSGVPINNTYEHSLYFKDREAQRNYFLSKVEQIYANYTYIREGHSIKVTGDISTAMTWNYLYYNNGDGKLFFNFIKRVVYVNEATVQLDLELDVIQTFMFDWQMKQAFIEREHTITDRMGEHTIPEGLETGPLVDNDIEFHNLEDLCIMFMTTRDATGNTAWCKMYDGVFSSLAIYAVNTDHWQQFGEWLDAQSANGNIDAIVSMWMYPKNLVIISGDWEDTSPLLKTVICAGIDGHICSKRFQTDIDGYDPQNKKMFTYPYNMLYVTNNEGGSAVYRRELFETDNDFRFNIYGGLAPECGCKLVPLRYKGVNTNYDEGLSMGVFPTCAWDSDTYKVWLAQNQHSLAFATTQAKIHAGAGLVSTIAAGLSGNLAGALGGLAVEFSALNTIQAQLAQKADMAIQPDQARGHYSANLNLANGRQGFDIHFRTITREYAERIDNYFTRYGYLVNRVDVPSLKNRSQFTYTKTVGCMVTGPFTTEHQIKIQSIFDKGVTFWVDPNLVGIYTIANTPDNND